jgi:hypothetical protein
VTLLRERLFPLRHQCLAGLALLLIAASLLLPGQIVRGVRNHCVPTALQLAPPLGLRPIGLRSEIAVVPARIAPKTARGDAVLARCEANLLTFRSLLSGQSGYTYRRASSTAALPAGLVAGVCERSASQLLSLVTASPSRHANEPERVPTLAINGELGRRDAAHGDRHDDRVGRVIDDEDVHELGVRLEALEHEPTATFPGLGAFRDRAAGFLEVDDLGEIAVTALKLRDEFGFVGSDEAAFLVGQIAAAEQAAVVSELELDAGGADSLNETHGSLQAVPAPFRSVTPLPAASLLAFSVL